MSATHPHFFLFSETQFRAPGNLSCSEVTRRKWRFVLEAIDGSSRLEAEDSERAADPNRLELLAVVRGLEALDQPSRVTLITASRYVSRGLRFGIREWRENNWHWERFGCMTPIRNGDLWQRVDRAMRYHQVDCRTWRFDLPETEIAPPAHEKRKVPVRDESQETIALSQAATERQGSWVDRVKESSLHACHNLLQGCRQHVTALVGPAAQTA